MIGKQNGDDDGFSNVTCHWMCEFITDELTKPIFYINFYFFIFLIYSHEAIMPFIPIGLKETIDINFMDTFSERVSRFFCCYFHMHARLTTLLSVFARPFFSQHFWMISLSIRLKITTTRSRAFMRKRSETSKRLEIRHEHHRATHRESVCCFATIIYYIMWNEDSFRMVSDTLPVSLSYRICSATGWHAVDVNAGATDRKCIFLITRIILLTIMMMIMMTLKSNVEKFIFDLRLLLHIRIAWKKLSFNQ